MKIMSNNVLNSSLICIKKYCCIYYSFLLFIDFIGSILCVIMFNLFSFVNILIYLLQHCSNSENDVLKSLKTESLMTITTDDAYLNPL